MIDSAMQMPLTHDQMRSRRKRAVPPRTICWAKQRAELKRGREEYPEVEDRSFPKTRAECKGGPRPCPFVGCRHNLYLDIGRGPGSIKLNFPDLEPWEIPETCALDVADAGGATLEQVAELMNLTRERIRQLEVKAKARLGSGAKGRQLRAHLRGER